MTFHRVIGISSALILATVASIAASETRLTASQPILVARGNITDGFRLPAGMSLSSSTVDLSDDGFVAIDGILANGNPGLFVGNLEGGGIVFEAPAGSLMSDVDLGTGGSAVISLSFATPDDVYRYDATTGDTAFVTSRPLGASSWTSVQENSQGTLGFRAGFTAGRAYVLFSGGADQIIATEASIEPGSPYAFLFTPALSPSEDRIAGKVRLGAAGQISDDQPDEIRVFDTSSSTRFARDRDADASSPFVRFDNGVSLASGSGGTRVAFAADLEDGVRGVFSTDGNDVRTIARDDGPDVSEILFFSPAMSADGLVVFRGLDTNGLEAVFVGDGNALIRIIGANDLVDTDRGTARLGQHDSSPVFGGGVAIDATGRVAFVAGLTPPDNNQIEWGSGVFVAQIDDTLFADGFESGTTTAWSSATP